MTMHSMKFDCKDLRHNWLDTEPRGEQSSLKPRTNGIITRNVVHIYIKVPKDTWDRDHNVSAQSTGQSRDQRLRQYEHSLSIWHLTLMSKTTCNGDWKWNRLWQRWKWRRSPRCPRGLHSPPRNILSQRGGILQWRLYRNPRPVP